MTNPEREQHAVLRWRRAIGRVVGLTWTLTACMGASALVIQDASVLEQGVRALEARRYEAALERFEAAFAADPSDGQAAFFAGVALNRLGRPVEALERLERAQALDYENPELGFEQGWALLGAGRWQEAIDQLEAYDQARPGRGQTSEFLGRAYLQLGELDRAEALLRQARRRDRTLEPTVQTYLALVEQRRGETAAAERRLQRVARRHEETPLGEALERFTERYVAPAAPTPVAPQYVPPPTDRPWRLSVSAGAGWNSNVLSVNEAVARAADITGLDSAFGRFGLQAAYDVLRSPADTVTLGYAVQADIYEGNLKESNYHDHFLYGDWRHQIGQDWSASLRLSDQYTNIGNNSFSNRAAVRPALAYRLTPWLAPEISYTLSYADFFFPTTAATNRDGFTHTAAITGYWVIPDTPISGRVGYFFSDNRADGREFQSQSHGVYLRVAAPLVARIEGEVGYTHVFTRYDNPSASVGASKRRSDDTDLVSVQLTRPVPAPKGLRARVYGRYDFTNGQSNVRFFDFDQHVVSAGVIVDF